jgi:ribulose-bisphosphate carboxylase large chain
VSFVRATYYVETPLTLEAAAEALASEQSTGTFIAVPLETAELKARYRARIERIELIETRSRPTLPGSRPASGQLPVRFRRACLSPGKYGVQPSQADGYSYRQSVRAF